MQLRSGKILGKNITNVTNNDIISDRTNISTLYYEKLSVELKNGIRDIYSFKTGNISSMYDLGCYHVKNQFINIVKELLNSNLEILGRQLLFDIYDTPIGFLVIKNNSKLRYTVLDRLDETIKYYSSKKEISHIDIHKFKNIQKNIYTRLALGYNPRKNKSSI
jgi:hypothetical protein